LYIDAMPSISSLAGVKGRGPVEDTADGSLWVELAIMPERSGAWEKSG
jgi:hypothetical protein